MRGAVRGAAQGTSRGAVAGARPKTPKSSYVLGKGRGPQVCEVCCGWYCGINKYPISQLIKDLWHVDIQCTAELIEQVKGLYFTFDFSSSSMCKLNKAGTLAESKTNWEGKILPYCVLNKTRTAGFYCLSVTHAIKTYSDYTPFFL